MTDSYPDDFVPFSSLPWPQTKRTSASAAHQEAHRLAMRDLRNDVVLFLADHVEQPGGLCACGDPSPCEQVRVLNAFEFPARD